MTQPLRILVTGSRRWGDEHAIDAALKQVLAEHATTAPPVLVVGDCPTGADALALKAWQRLRHSWPGLGAAEVHRADWDGRGRGAGLIRNQAMVNTGATVCLAFLTAESRGTRDCAAKARTAGIPVREFQQVMTS